MKSTDISQHNACTVTAKIHNRKLVLFHGFVAMGRSPKSSPKASPKTSPKKVKKSEVEEEKRDVNSLKSPKSPKSPKSAKKVPTRETTTQAQGGLQGT